MNVALSDNTVRRRFPQSIAAAWGRTARTLNDDERIVRLAACNEVLLRTLAAMLLPDYLRGPAAPALTGMFEKFPQKPSEGVWLGLVRELIRAVGERRDPPPFIPEIYPWFFSARGGFTDAGQALTDFVAVRNVTVHPKKIITPEETSERARRLHQLLRSVLLDMGWLPGYRPFRVAAMETTRGGTFTGKVQFLVGTEESEFLHGEWAPHLVRQAVYLTNPDGTALLDLMPFAEFQDQLYLVKGFDALRSVELVHDVSGTQLSRQVETLDGEVPFKAVLEKQARYSPYFGVGTESSIFSLTAPGLAVESNIDLGPRFEKREVLGEGGMAVVFRVFDRDKKKEYALKVLKSELADDVMCCKRFRREAANMSRVKHPRIMSMIEIDQLPNGQPWLMMPVMAKGSLQEQIIRGTGRDEALVRRWAQEALEALQCIHGARMVHRDIKPSNFLVDDDDHIMLTDFGIALGANDEHWTETLRLLATIAYMAPEQETNQEITEKADIYSLAIVLHELLTGVHQKRTPGKGIRGRFGDLIRRMGAPNPASRPTATQALDELRMWTPAKTRNRVRREPRDPIREIPPEPTRETPPDDFDREREAAAEEQRRRDAEALAARQRLEAEAARVRRVEEERQAELRQKATASRQRLIAASIFILLFAFNWIETTTVETWLRSPAESERQRSLADAAMWFENGLTFEHHEGAEELASYGFSAAYFAVFPLLLIVTAIVLARRRDPGAFLLFATSAAVDYLLALPFYLFFPVPERWSYPDANAILLSDLVDTRLIEAIRPFSGLNNCFPSFHVSLTVLAVLCLYRARVPFLRTAIPLACAIILSTFALGIHWIPDIIAGLAAGIVSVWLAAYILERTSLGTILTARRHPLLSGT